MPNTKAAFKLYATAVSILLVCIMLLPPYPLKAAELTAYNQYTFRETIVVKNVGNEPAKNVRLEIPLMSELTSGYQQLINTHFSINPVSINSQQNGSKTAAFQLSLIDRQETVHITVTYSIAIRDSELDTAQLTAAYQETNSLYLNSEPKIESDSLLLKQAVYKIYPNGKPQTPQEILALAKAAYKFTQDSLTYNLNSPAANEGALAGLEYGQGSCVEYASLFTALCRTGGVQARIVNGFANDLHTLETDDLKSSLHKSRHQWAEFYLPSQGWIPVDPTLAKPGRELFGSLPAGYYMIQNYGDLPLKGSYQGSKLNITFQYKIDKN